MVAMQISSRVRQRPRATERQEILSAYRRSKLTQREFARQAGIGFSMLRKWLSRARLQDGAGSRSRFVQLPHPLVQPGQQARYRLHPRPGVVWEVGSGFVSEEVAVFLRVLAAL